MNQKTTLQISSYPKAMRTFAEENLNLKFLCASLLGLFFVMLLLVLYLVKKGPMVIALDNTGEITRVESKVTDLQVKAAIKEYVSYRYSWTDGTIANQVAKAKFFVLPSLVSAFDKSMAETQKFVREKKITQRVYPKSVDVDLKEKKVTVLADRVTEFENLKAATEMRLVLQIALDDRTVVNPWGIYITKETEEARP
ncbi:MAG: VirB8/TrbF family protein [Bdellovibrionales bacterium]